MSARRSQLHPTSSASTSGAHTLSHSAEVSSTIRYFSSSKAVQFPERCWRNDTRRRSQLSQESSAGRIVLTLSLHSPRTCNGSHVWFKRRRRRQKGGHFRRLWTILRGNQNQPPPSNPANWPNPTIDDLKERPTRYPSDRPVVSPSAFSIEIPTARPSSPARLAPDSFVRKIGWQQRRVA